LNDRTDTGGGQACGRADRTARSHEAANFILHYAANSAFDANDRLQAERYHSGVDRERMILDAAAAVFYEKGFHGAGVDELGKRAGLTGPTLYRYFSSKEEILAALFNEAMDELVSATAMVHEDPRADLARLIRHHVEFAVSQRQLVNVYQREDRSLTGSWKRHFNHRRKQYVSRWEAILARCVPGAAPDEVAALTQSILGLIFSIAYWPPQTAGVAGLPDLIVGFTLQGLPAAHLVRPLKTSD
jgi:AcrR family transcriptional regulator